MNENHGMSGLEYRFIAKFELKKKRRIEVIGPDNLYQNVRMDKYNMCMDVIHVSFHPYLAIFNTTKIN